MEDQRFDQWTRAAFAITTRRGLARPLVAGALAAVLTRFSGKPAAAKCRTPGQTCDKKDKRRRRCCGGATCRGKRCRCPKGRERCGKKCCPKGHFCDGGACVTRRADCPATADLCIPGAATTCAGRGDCQCFQRRQGGVHCGFFDFSPEVLLVCNSCATDAHCLALGFPAGSSCVKEEGSFCNCPNPGVDLGACVAPCPGATE